MNYKSYLRIPALLFIFCCGSLFGFSETPGQVLDKVVSKINSAKAIECAFTVSAHGQKSSGSIIASRSKFKLVTPLGTTWYDGREMWTANKSTKEITVVNPTEQEVHEANPFSYIDGYKNRYNVFFSKRRDSKYHLVLLNPKSKKDDIKAIEIAVNKTTLLPERFILRDRKDNVTTLKITSLSLRKDVAEHTFSCPTADFRDYEIIDLK